MARRRADVLGAVDVNGSHGSVEVTNQNGAVDVTVLPSGCRSCRPASFAPIRVYLAGEPLHGRRADSFGKISTQLPSGSGRSGAIVDGKIATGAPPAHEQQRQHRRCAEAGRGQAEGDRFIFSPTEARAKTRSSPFLEALFTQIACTSLPAESA